MPVFPAAWEGKAGESQVAGQARQHSQISSKENNKTENRHILKMISKTKSQLYEKVSIVVKHVVRPMRNKENVQTNNIMNIDWNKCTHLK